MTMSILRQRKSCRDFSDDLLDEEVLRSIIEDASYAPSGGNEQPWKVVLVPPLQGIRVRSLFEQRGWDDLFPKLWSIAEKMAGDSLPMEEATARIHQMVERDGIIRGMPWGVAIHYEPERLSGPALHRIAKRSLGSTSGLSGALSALTMMARVSPGVRHDSVVCFVHSLCLAATERHLGSCIQHSYLNYRTSLARLLQIPRGERLAALVWIGRASEDQGSAVGRGRRPVSVRSWNPSSSST